MKVVPLSPGGQSSWVQRTALGGVDFLLTLDWSQREGVWTLTLSDATESIISSHALVTSWLLLRRVTDPRRPAGELLVIDTGGAGTDPTFASLGDRHKLVYLDPSEVP